MKYLITEEQNLKLRLFRRLEAIDDSIPFKMVEYDNLYNICKLKVDDYISSIVGGISHDLYYAYFSDLDDNSKEWKTVFDLMENYIYTNFGHRIADYYFQKCNTENKD